MQPEDYADFLVQQSRSAVSALHEFRMLHGTNDDAHIFLEGDEDIHYYLPEVRRLRPGGEVHHYVCGGKWNVVDVMNSIDEGGYAETLCLFFVDRDYDDLFEKQVTPSERLYVTDGYSIENAVATRDTARTLLTDFARVSPADPIIQEVLDAVEAGLVGFDKVITPYLAWALAVKSKGGKPNFNNVDLKDILVIDADCSVKKKNRSCHVFLSRCLPKEASVPHTLVREWVIKLRALSSDARLRGKFKLWFFERALVIALQRAIGETKGDRRRVPAALREHRIIEVLGGRLKYPETLTDFLVQSLS